MGGDHEIAGIEPPGFRPGRWLTGRGWWLLPLLIGVTVALPWVFGDRWYSDAPYYQAISTQMVREGCWWSPMQGDLHYFNKPPLGFWIHGALIAAFGNVDWATHAPEAVYFVLVCLLVGGIARRLHGARAGMITGCVMALNNEWIWRVGNIKLDSLHTTLLLGAMACWVWAFVKQRTEDEPSPRLPETEKRAGEGRREIVWCILAGACIGGALMTKPIFALALPVLAWIWLRVSGLLTARRTLLVLMSAAIGVAIAAPWHVSMALRHGDAFLGAYIHEQTLKRVMGEMHDRQPWYWYVKLILGVIPEAVDPWKMWPEYALALGGLAVVATRWRRTTTRAGDALAAIWMVAWFVGISAFSGKRNYYMFVVHPGVAWLAGIAVVEGLRMAAAAWGERGVRVALRAAATLGVLACVVTLTRVPHAVGKARRELPVPDRDELMAFLRSHRGEEIYNCGMQYRIASLAYIEAGVWPRSFWERGQAPRDRVPVGAMMCYRDDLLNNPEYGIQINPADRLVFKSSPTGQFMVYERR